MDIETLKTFLSVVSTGSFAMAAERMNVTQSTISSRVAILEEKLGYRLFWRNRSGARLSDTGKKFLDHARQMVHIWERACGNMIPETSAFAAQIRIGCQPLLWEKPVRNLCRWMQKNTPETAVKIETGDSQWLADQLFSGQIDLALLQEVPGQAALVSRKLFEEDLILVASNANQAGPGTKGYVYINWGPEFEDQHNEHYAHYAFPTLTVNNADIALDHIFTNGGSAFMPTRLVHRYIASEKLQNVKIEGHFFRSIFAVYARKYENDMVKTLLSRLRRIGRS